MYTYCGKRAGHATAFAGLHENLYLMPKFPYGSAKFPAAPTGTLFAGYGALAQGDAVAPGTVPPTQDANTGAVVAPAPPQEPKTGGWAEIIGAATLNTIQYHDPHRTPPRTRTPAEQRLIDRQVAAAQAAEAEKKALRDQIAALEGRPKVSKTAIAGFVAMAAVAAFLFKGDR